MEVKDYLDKVAYVSVMDFGIGDVSKVYKSKYDDSYITLVGMEDKIKYLADLEITEELTHGVGFSPKDNKWYGWSHRAIYGFTIGSTCKKGDCHYRASTPEELIDEHANFFADISPESVERHRAECQILDDRRGIRILHTPVKLPVAKSLEEAISAINDPSALDEELLFKDDYTVIKCGRGEWTAKTMDDAKQMAIDFNEGVS